MVQARGVPRPFLKWAGGKGQLLPDLMRCVDLLDGLGRYHEPFVGGGALFFELARQGRLGRLPACLSDSNPRLIEVYEGVKEEVEGVIERLREHRERHNKDYYYHVRSYVPKTLAERAARIIYLNRTCYNGLFRENSRGEFNVPVGRYGNPMICDEENLRAAAQALGNATIEARPFESVLERAESGDLVYFDPPYHPVSETASFTAYAKGGFSEEDQRRLAAVFASLADKGVRVLLSNSKTPFVEGLYRERGYVIEEILATRSVNSRADRRGAVSEVLVRSF